MTDPSQALGLLREHFEDAVPGQIDETAKRHSPELVLLDSDHAGENDELVELGLRALPAGATQSSIVTLFRPDPASLPLHAYLASALTGLDGAQRQLIFQLSDAIGVVCHDLGISLYEPRKNTDPVHHASVPDSDVFHPDLDRERVLRSDLLVYLAHYPSTGAGEELDFALNALVPIIVIAHRSTRVSRMITGIPGLVVVLEYDEPEELRTLLGEKLAQIRPLLVQRALAFGTYDVNIVGDRIRSLRQQQGLTRADIAKATAGRFPISVEMIARWETQTDRDSDLSLVQLREIATALKTTVADLVEPDLQQVLISGLADWVGGRPSARFSGSSNRDRNRILRRLLSRLIDDLDDDG